MTSSELTKEQAGLRRATLMGIVAGLRSQTPLGVMARAVDHGEIAPPAGALGRLLRSPQGRRVLKLSALGEVIVDKTPLARSRVSPKNLLGRLGFGALAAATLAQTQGTPVVPAALRGAAGAGLGSVAGFTFRIVAGRVTGLPDLLVALAEDAVAVGLARSAINPGAIADLAAEQDDATIDTTTSAEPPAPSTVQATIPAPPPPPTIDTPAAAPPGEGEAGTEAPTAPVPSA